MSEVWEKRESETARAYRAFCVYRDMGVDRSLAKVREKLDKKTGYERQLGEWSSDHEWVKRVAAYDAHLEALLRNEQEERLVAERRRQTERELTDTTRLLTEFDDLIKQVESGADTLTLAALDTQAAYLERIYRMRRLALSMQQKITQAQHTGENGGPMQVMWIDPLGEDDAIGEGADELPGKEGEA